MAPFAPFDRGSGRPRRNTAVFTYITTSINVGRTVHQSLCPTDRQGGRMRQGDYQNRMLSRHHTPAASDQIKVRPN
jgi:hypothetical protein